MEQHFWLVSAVSWAATAVGVALHLEQVRRGRARRRAQFAAMAVAVRGAGDAMRELGPAAAKAAEAFRQFGRAFSRRPAPKHK